MNSQELRAKLDELMALPAETEWVEFKAARQDFDFRKMGKYFSALSNESNLKGQPCGWLVFGVPYKPRQVVGTQYRPNRPDLDSLKKEVADKTNNRITFAEIHEIMLPEGRVVMFQIPAAPQGIPTSWEGHFYGRDGESIGPLNLYEIEEIRGQGRQVDWSAQVCAGASTADLDPAAIAKAREEYKKKQQGRAAEVDGWDDTTFLNKAKVLVGGGVTNAAIILLGREESAHFILPAVAQITWVLRDANGKEKDYEHFGPPLVLATNAAFAKIRNLKYRYMRDASLFPAEITQYEPWVIREALHNCIAHQDYSLGGRINVVEDPDSLLLTNVGSFIPQTVERVIEQDAPPERYRNPFLAAAMVNLNMIDTIGSGIKRMFTVQRERFFPLPDYDLSDPQRVKVRLIGEVLDENYTRALMANTDLGLPDVIALDKVQKRMPISVAEFRSLKAHGLIEGRRPNLFVAAHVAAVTGNRAAYIRNRAFDKAHYKKMVIAYLEKYDSASRKDIEALLMSKLSDALTAEQRQNQIGNLLHEMSRKDGRIRAEGRTRSARWVLAK